MPRFGEQGAGSPSNTMSHGPTSVPSCILIHPVVWPQHTWAENWGLCLFGVEGELGSHLTQCGQGPAYLCAKFYLDLIHPTFWLQYTNVTDIQIGQTAQTGQTTV